MLSKWDSGGIMLTRGKARIRWFTIKALQRLRHLAVPINNWPLREFDKERALEINKVVREGCEHRDRGE